MSSARHRVLQLFEVEVDLPVLVFHRLDVIYSLLIGFDVGVGGLLAAAFRKPDLHPKPLKPGDEEEPDDGGGRQQGQQDGFNDIELEE